MADAKLVIKPPHMEVRMKPGSWPDVAKMFETIKDAGYQPMPDRVELRVSGKLVKQGDHFALELDRMAAPRAILVTAGETAASLEGRVGQVVELEGAWTEPREGKPGELTVSGRAASAGKSEGR